MKTVPYWSWWINSETTGKRSRTRWKMSAETAAGYLGAVPVEGSMELRSLPESAAEIRPQSTGDYMSQKI